MTDTLIVNPTAVPTETVTPIRPSEAIRLGCLVAPVQAFGALSDGEGTACAMGAFYIGMGAWDGHGDGRGILPDGGVREGFHRIASLPCEVTDCTGAALGITGPAHLNDDHRWSRERIADWLEGMGL